MSVKPSHGLALSAVVMLSLLAAGYWLVGLCYSRGYDYFLWLYNAWIAGQYIWSGDWPNWSSHSAAGHPFFKTAGVVDAIVFSLFTQTAGIELGTQLYASFLYVISGIGIYCLICFTGGTRAGGIVGATAYVFSWFLTFTAYYQTYLSNFLLYAFMPWGALFFARAVVEQSRAYLLASAGVLFLSITVNAQVSIKVLLFAVPIALVETVVRGIPRSRWFLYSMAFVGLALCWSTFLIIPALAYRQEVFLLGALRSVQSIKPWEVLFSIPIYGLNMLWTRMGFSGFLDVEALSRAIYTDYIGLSVTAISVAGVFAKRRSLDRRLSAMLVLLAGYWLVYFFIVPNLKPSSWIGITHNWAILPTLVLAMLCRYGCEWVTQYWSTRLSIVALCSLIVVDLGGVSFFLNRLAITHLPLEELPEVGVWREVENMEENTAKGRWFTYNPDHTHYLLPIFTGRETANIIELRGRNPEYNSYLVHQLRAMRELDPTYKPSESLALLDCEYVDLPVKIFDYRGDASTFTAGVEMLRSDAQLELIHQRPWERIDASYDALRSDLDVSYILDRGQPQTRFSQVVFRNAVHYWAAIPERVVLLAGDTGAGQALFEKITHLDNFHAIQILYVLDDGGLFDERTAQAFDGYISVDGSWEPESIAQWTLGDIERVYADVRSAQAGSPELVSRGEEKLEIQLPELSGDTFLFLSRQRFGAWKAYGESGAELTTYKAGAGLTAIWLPRATKRIDYQYETPVSEQWARAFSLMSLAGALIWLCWRRLRGASL